MSRVVEYVTAYTKPFGLDLVCPFYLKEYNAIVAKEHQFPESFRSTAFGILLGHSKFMWPCFKAFLKEHPSFVEIDNPLDTFVVENVTTPCFKNYPINTYKWYYPFESFPRILFQQVSRVAMAGAFLPSVMLNVHPVYGPWIGFRALVVIDVNENLIISQNWREWEKNVLYEYPSQVFAEWELSVKRLMSEKPFDWQKWSNLRKEIGKVRGSQFEYYPDQLEYHYTKNKKILLNK